jgi:DNA recombination protein RmuC
MPAVWLIVGAVVGAAIVFVIARVRVMSADELIETLRGDVERLRSERDSSMGEVSDLREQLGGGREAAVGQLAEVREAAAQQAALAQQQLAGVQTELATAQTELRKEREAHAERLQEKEAELQRLDERVKAALTDALGGSTKHLVAVAKAELGKERSEAKAEIEAEHQRVNHMFESVSQVLGKVEGKLGEVEKERVASREQLDAQLATLKDSHKELLAGTQALVGALHRPEVRGRWGEFQLRNLVEQAGMLRHVDFDEQPKVEGDDGILRPDACVHMPGRRDVIIDSKVPLDALMAASAATSPDERERLLGEHARQLRTHLNKLDSKSYWDALPCTPDFVVMFVPSDEVVLAAMRADRKLAHDVYAKRVVIASPMNLMALLRVIALGWRQEKLAENAEEVERLGRDLHNRLGVFARKLRGLGKRIGTLLKSWNEVVGSFDHNVLPASRRFAELGLVAEDQELERPDALPFAPREVQGRGLPELEGGRGEDDSVVEFGDRDERDGNADEGDHKIDRHQINQKNGGSDEKAPAA